MRWKLAVPHYLNVDGAKWEYQEVNRTNGKTMRLQVPVPTLLDPRDPADFTHKWGLGQEGEGEVIVSLGPSSDPKDIIFTGDPTPDMIPLDDEAKALSASFAERWRYKPDSEVPGTFSQSLIDRFQATMAETASKPAQIEGLDELIKTMAAVVQSNQELTSRLVRRP